MSSSRRAYVIGAGLAGLWVAQRLRREGYDVTVFEAHEPGYGASSRAAGIVSLQLPPRLLSYAVEGLAEYKAMGIAREVASLWIPRPEQLRCALRVVDFLEKYGIPSTAGTIRELVNHGVVEGDEPAILMTQAIVSPGDAINILTKELYGAWVIDEPATFKGGKVYVNGRPLDDGPVFVAAGPWTRELLGIGGLEAYRCSAFGIEGSEGAPALIIEDDQLGFYYVPESDRRGLVAGGDSSLASVSEGFRVNIYEAYEVLELISKRMPQALNMRPTSAWAAPCVVAVDGMPVVGEVPGMNNVYLLTGLDGAGLTLSPGISRLLVEAFEGVAEVPAFMRPERLSGVRGHFVEPFDLICEG